MNTFNAPVTASCQNNGTQPWYVVAARPEGDFVEKVFATRPAYREIEQIGEANCAAMIGSASEMLMVFCKNTLAVAYRIGDDLMPGMRLSPNIGTEVDPDMCWPGREWA